MTDVLPSEDEIKAARSGLYLQLSETTKIIEEYGSLAQAIDDLGLYDFIENQTMTNASRVAWVRHTENRLNNSSNNCDDINEVISCAQKAFGKIPMSCDKYISVDSVDYNRLADSINKLSGNCR